MDFRGWIHAGQAASTYYLLKYTCAFSLETKYSDEYFNLPNKPHIPLSPTN